MTDARKTSRKKTGAKRASKTAAAAKKNRPAPVSALPLSELIGFVIMGLAIVSVVVLLTVDGQSNIVRSLLSGLSGMFAYVTCAVMLWIGLLTAFHGKKQLNVRRITMIALMILIVYAMVHIFFAQDIMRSLILGGGWLNFIRESFYLRIGTGAIGAILAYPAYIVMGKWGGFAVLLFVLLTDIIVLNHVSLSAVGEKAQDYLHEKNEQIREQHRIRSEERQAEREERQNTLNKGGWANWNIPVVTDSSAAVTASPKTPEPAADERETVFSEGFEMPDHMKGKKRRTGKPVLKMKNDEALIGDIETGQTDETGREPANTATPFPVIPVQPVIADEVEEEAVDIPDAGSGNDNAGAGIQTPLETDGVIPYESDDASEDDIPDGLDEADVIPGEKTDPDEPVPIQRQKEHTPQEPKPSFFEATERRLDNTPVVSIPNVKKDDADDTAQIYNYPPIDLLALPKPSAVQNARQKDEEKAQKLSETLKSFGINATLKDIAHGPAVTRFELAPAAGVKVSRITALSDDIALNLAATSIRIEAPIPGKAAVGVEVPNDIVEIVPLREVLESQDARRNPSRLAVALGKDNSGRYIIGDVAKFPHVLIAGATGSGKSVCINCIICSILYRATPEEVRLIMIDPKVVELSIYNGIPHLLQPVVTDPKKAAGALHWAVAEMTDRYRLFAEKSVHNIKGYNKKCAAEGKAMMPQIVIIIDELADLLMAAPKEVEDSICRLAQLARAAGIHLVIATQRPSVNVITGVIKANIPARIAFTVSSSIDSRTILDVGGAEKLLGNGDMLFSPVGSNRMQRVQGAWVSDDEILKIVEYIKSCHEPDYNEDLLNYMDKGSDEAEQESDDSSDHETDPLMPQALEIAVTAGQVSISMLQRKLSIGYARAGRLVDEMATKGYVSASEGSKARSVIITREQFMALYGSSLK